MVNTILILAGGDGMRLKEITGDTSKPLIDLGGEPLLTKIIRKTAAELNINNIYLLIQKKHRKQYLTFLEQYREFYKYNIKLWVEETKLGTGGAIKNFLKNNDVEYFYVTNADTIINTSIKDFTRAKINSILCTMVKSNNRFGSIEKDEENYIIKFNNAEHSCSDTLVNAGVYKLSRNIFDLIYEDIFDIEQTLFSLLANQSQIYAYEMELLFEDIGIPEAYYKEIKKYEKY